MEGNYKIYIIAEAEKMTPEASNSILKILEEPPGIMVLILLTSVYGALLSTIRSRCQSLKFSPIPLNLITDKLVKGLKIPESKAKWAAIRSQGRFGIAMELAEEEKTEDEISLDFLLPGGKNKESLMSIFKKAEKLEKTEQSLDILLSWYRDILLIKQGCSEDLLTYNDRLDDLKKVSKLYSAIQLEKLIKTIIDTQNLIKRNINSNLAMEVMMLHSFKASSIGF